MREFRRPLRDERGFPFAAEGDEGEDVRALRFAAADFGPRVVEELGSSSRPMSSAGAYLTMREMSAWKGVDFGMPSFGALCGGM